MSEPAKKPNPAPESYSPSKPEILSMAADAASLSSSGGGEKILEGVPVMHYGNPSAVCFIGAVMRLLEYLGDPVDEAELFALSGAGLCFPWRYASSCDEVSIIPEIPPRTFRALGYESEYLYEQDISGARRYSKEFYQAKIIQSIGEGRPVIGFGFTEQNFACLVTGCAKGGEGLYLRAYWSPEGQPDGYAHEQYYYTEDWYEKCHGVVLAGGKTGPRLTGAAAYDHIRETARIFRGMTSVTAEGLVIPTGSHAFSAMEEWLLEDDWSDLSGKEPALKQYGLLLLNHYRWRLNCYLQELDRQNPGLVNPRFFAAWERQSEMIKGSEHSDLYLDQSVDPEITDFSKMADRAVREKVAGFVRRLAELDAEILDSLCGAEGYSPARPEILNLAERYTRKGGLSVAIPERFTLAPKEKIADFSGERWPFSNVSSAVTQALGLFYGRTEKRDAAGALVFDDLEYSIQNCLTGEAFGTFYCPALAANALGLEIYGLAGAEAYDPNMTADELQKLVSAHVAGGNTAIVCKNSLPRAYLVFGYENSGDTLLCVEFEDGNDTMNCSYDFAKPLILRDWTEGVTGVELIGQGRTAGREAAYRQALAHGVRLMTLRTPDPDMDIPLLRGAGLPLYAEWISQLERASAENSDVFYFAVPVYPHFIALYENRQHLWKFLKLCADVSGDKNLSEAAGLCEQLKNAAVEAAQIGYENQYSDPRVLAMTNNQRRDLLVALLEKCRGLEAEVTRLLESFLR